MSNRIELSKQVGNLFREYRSFKPKTKIGLIYQTIKAILNVMQAFDGKLKPSKILKAVGNAKNPNAVSRAVRSRLPKI